MGKLVQLKDRETGEEMYPVTEESKYDLIINLVDTTDKTQSIFTLGNTNLINKLQEIFVLTLVNNKWHTEYVDGKASINIVCVTNTTNDFIANVLPNIEVDDSVVGLMDCDINFAKGYKQDDEVGYVISLFTSIGIEIIIFISYNTTTKEYTIFGTNFTSD